MTANRALIRVQFRSLGLLFPRQCVGLIAGEFLLALAVSRDNYALEHHFSASRAVFAILHTVAFADGVSIRTMAPNPAHALFRSPQIATCALRYS